ncbi:uncharacterized protein LOC121875093 [Homarus americanus]|uniref:uncharacterized protein LOC121875093 n=1 Tax=Homarus americanus TaxID=6706 RepID=UPI001C4932C5|nr:uncharacterized protein LOC121875093 [Homarus americanus]
MIHLVVVLSAVALTASDATPAVYPSTTHSLHTHLAVISPVTLCTVQHTMPTFATLPASGVIPHPPDISSASSVCLNTLNYFLFLTQLQSTEHLSPLLQTSISNTTRVHACPWKQIWNTLMWLCLHTNLMKQTRAKYNKQPVQLHSNYRLNKQIPWPLRNSKRKKQAQNSKENFKQIQNVQVPKNSNKEIPQMQTPPDNKEITRTPAVTDNILESLSQTHQENNKEMPQTQKHTNSNKHILQTAIPQYDSKQELQTQSPAKNRQHKPQAQIPMVNRQRRQMMVFLESKQQIPQMPSDKNKKVIPHTLTDNSRQNQQTPTYRNKHIQQKKTLVGIRVKMPRTQTTSNNQKSVQQVHTHKSERKQLLEKTSDWMLHNNCLHIARNQPSVPYSLTAAPETAVPSSRSWVGAQEHTSSTKSTLQALPLFAALFQLEKLLPHEAIDTVPMVLM